MPIRTAVSVRDEQVKIVSARATNGYIRIYSGTQPAKPELAATGTLLAELRLAGFTGPKGDATLRAEMITKDTGRATGRAKWYRVVQEDGKTAVFDGDITLQGKGGSLEFDSVEVQKGAEVSLQSFIVALPL